MPKVFRSLSFAIAHRGAPRLAPENTIAALMAAKEAGAKWVECDVRLTKDHAPIIFHDATVNRLTNGSGYVSQHTLSQIKSLHCRTERIPALFEWLQCCMTLDMHLQLEMKAHSKKQAKILADCVLHELKQSRFPLSNLVISSFYLDCLIEIYKKNKSIALGFISKKKISDNTTQRLLKMQFFSVHLHYTLLDDAMVDHFHRHGFSVLAYTVDDIRTAKKLKSMGVDAVFTNNEKMFGIG